MGYFGQLISNKLISQTKINTPPLRTPYFSVFGVDLTTVVKLKNIDNIPALLHKGMSIVEEQGTDSIDSLPGIRTLLTAAIK